MAEFDQHGNNARRGAWPTATRWSLVLPEETLAAAKARSAEVSEESR